ncbi:MAG: hypothetical protein A4E30_00137 [Methanomassiliicoccales archaeon PtaB.Bin215]|nr:MAG: hypothetical protein A4E30_00137 [Methanomassiliicoccales archaeon PtaB.Bin215]
MRLVATILATKSSIRKPMEVMEPSMSMVISCSASPSTSGTKRPRQPTSSPPYMTLAARGRRLRAVIRSVVRMVSMKSLPARPMTAPRSTMASTISRLRSALMAGDLKSGS